MCSIMSFTNRQSYFSSLIWRASFLFLVQLLQLALPVLQSIKMEGGHPLLFPILAWRFSQELFTLEHEVSCGLVLHAFRRLRWAPCMPALLRAFALGYRQRCHHNHPWAAEHAHPERVHRSPIRRQKPGARTCSEARGGQLPALAQARGHSQGYPHESLPTGVFSSEDNECLSSWPHKGV